MMCTARAASMRADAQLAMPLSSSKSRTMVARISGRTTLTTTSRPSGRAAVCTCAMEAAASGLLSKRANRRSSGCSKPVRGAMICAIATSGLNGLTLSWSLTSCSIISGGTRSRRVESSWPSFKNSVPMSSSAYLMPSCWCFLPHAAGCKRISRARGASCGISSSGKWVSMRYIAAMRHSSRRRFW